MAGLRERKKQETRQRLADLATMLFAQRGFDNVSVADVAAAAGVSKMTVFNYFQRKEDLLFDRVPELDALLTTAVRDRHPDQTPVAAVRELVLRLLDERHPLGGFADTFPGFWQIVLDSPALRARAREAVDEAEDLLARLYAESYGDGRARLTAALTLAAWRTCYLSGARRIMAGEHADDFAAEHRAWVAECFAAVPGG
jgi:AcrR family transcriptional regulator